MIRSIRPGPRPAIALGVMVTLFGLVVLVASIHQHRFDLIEGWLVVVAILSIALLRIYSVRIDVGEDYIARVDGFWSTQTLRFGEIERSVPCVVAERNHPLWLDVYPNGRVSKSQVLRLPLKVCREADVAWLMSLKQLRIKT